MIKALLNSFVSKFKIDNTKNLNKRLEYEEIDFNRIKEIVDIKSNVIYAFSLRWW